MKTLEPTQWSRIPGSPLEWAAEVSSERVSWEYAQTKTAEMGGRLPTQKELVSLIDYECADNAARLGIPPGWYWTAESYAPDRYGAWIVGMDNGYVDNGTKPGYYHFWACRGGQEEDDDAIVLDKPDKLSPGPSGADEMMARLGEIQRTLSLGTDRIIEAIAIHATNALGYKTTPERIRALKIGGAK